ncbi:hypothetical protein AB0M28_04655 [Streptomyces sp. NPDC051940]|uniref:hypothetical protein n=1 Tax=Streptomyces sp. NPDC051940 TaxID=3155675 RepID=UPI003423097C
MRPPQTTYTDELLADRSAHRRYDDGREEWRRRDGANPNLVHWRDNHGGSGTDEAFARRIVKRTYAAGGVRYGRDLGYGRTVWGQGEYVMVNRTSFGGRTGAILAAIGVTSLAVTAAQLPPVSLSEAEEEELRQQLAQQQQAQGSGSDGGGADSGGGDDGGWHDDGDWSDDDFG